MKLYSDFASQRARQVLFDVMCVAFVVAWAALGVATYRLIMGLTDFGVQMQDAGAGFRETMSEVGDTLGGIYGIGAGIRVPFDSASSAGGALEQAGETQQGIVQTLALVLGVGGAALPILMIAVLWLLFRGRFVRRAARAQELVRGGVGVDLLALRALSTQNITRITRVHPDAVGAWRRGDEEVMRQLASLELEASGIRLRG